MPRFYLALLLWSTMCMAQGSLYAQLERPLCGTSQIMKQADPKGGLRFRLDREIHDHRREQLEEPVFAARGASAVTLPVVFHVVSDPSNPIAVDIARTQLALDQLNAAFANEAPYDPTRGVATDIAFCLARRSPSQTAIDGYTFTSSPLGDHDLATQEAALKAVINYEPLDYINIYVVNSIRSGANAGVAGYARLPTAHGGPLDGIVIEAGYFGTSDANAGVLVHEMGHYLGLYHTFEGGCQNDDCTVDGDRVCDTPPDNSTARIACDETMNTCDTDANSGLASDLPDDTHNYMDYTTLACMTAFTAGQSDRMHGAIDAVRSSLLLSAACSDPCNSPLTGTVTLSPPPYLRGSTLTASATVAGATRFAWRLSGTPIGTAASFSTPLLSTGLQTVSLIATNADSTCYFRLDTSLLVSCEVDPSFTVSPTSVAAGGTLTLSADVANPLNEFSVNGTSIGMMASSTFAIPVDGGTFRLCHTAANAFCAADSCITLTVPRGSTGCTNCVEICDNGIDDNGDGYIDCYDTACECFDGVDCVLDSVENLEFAARVAWASQTNFRVSATSSPIVINLDPQRDNISEIITVARTREDLYIFQGDGSNKDNPDVLPTDQLDTYSRSLIAAADLDGDGSVELVVPSQTNLYIYGDFNPGSSPPMRRIAGYPINLNSAVNLADFDGDGMSEILSAEALVYSPTGRLSDYRELPFPALPPTGANGIAADVLRPIDCGGNPDCNGLELIIGSYIYSVDLSTTDGDGVSLTQQRFTDFSTGRSNPGYSSVADVDHDGVLDILLSGNNDKGFMVYNRGGRLFEHTYNNSSGFDNVGSACVIETLDDRTFGAAENYPELLVISDNRFTAFNANAATRNPRSPFWWQLTVDDRSGFTGVTAFDFNGDGLSEIVYHDEEYIRITYGGPAPYPAGVDAERNYFKLPLTNLTADEIPLVADCDGDGEAEIISLGSNQVTVIEGDPTRGSPWAGTRSMWNQRDYYHVNINDDLTIPRQQQEHHLEFPTTGSGRRPFNRAYAQQPIFNNDFEPVIPVADALVDFEDVRCSGSRFEAEVVICNDGSRRLATGVPLTIYDADPLAGPATLIGSSALPRPIAVDSCDTITLAFTLTTGGDAYVFVNDNATATAPFDLDVDFPTTGTAECDYTNNLVRIPAPNSGSTTPPDLGPDLLTCATQPQTFGVDNTWEEVLWSDGSSGRSFTAADPGTYWVRCTDYCKNVYTDTVRIVPDVGLEPNLGPDTTLCLGDTFALSLDGFREQRWTSDVSTLSCDTCTTITIPVDSSFSVRVQTVAANGCVALDTLAVVAGEVPSARTTPIVDSCATGLGAIEVVGLSAGSTWSFAGYVYPASTSYLDSVLAGTYAIELKATSGCVVLDSVTIEAPFAVSPPPPDLGPDRLACATQPQRFAVDTVWKQVLWSDGTADVTFDAPAPGTFWVRTTDFCDNVFTDTVQFAPDLALIPNLGPDTALCLGDTFSLSLSGFDTQLWASAETVLTCDTCRAVTVAVANSFTLRVNTSADNGCPAADTIAVLAKALPVAIATPSVDSCNRGTGSVRLTGLDAADSWELDGVAYAGSTAVVSSLFAGTYPIAFSAANGCVVTDSVTIEAPFAISPPPPDLGPDLIACATEAQRFEVDTVWKRVLWSDGTDDLAFIAPAPGTFWVRTTDYCDNAFSDTVQVSPDLALIPNLGPDTSLCVGETLSLMLSGFDAQQWASDDTALACDTCSTLQFAVENSFTVRVRTTADNGCVAADTLLVVANPIPIAVASPTADSCARGTGAVALTGLTAGDTWTLNGDIYPATTTTVRQLPRGEYPLVVEGANGCLQRDTVTVDSLPPLAINLGLDTLLCTADTLRLSLPDDVQGWWQTSTGRQCNDCPSLTLTPSDSGTVFVAAVDANDCPAADTLVLAGLRDITTSVTDPTCTPYRLGSIDLVAPMPLSVTIAGTTQQGSFTLSDLDEGPVAYTVTQGHCQWRDTLAIGPLGVLEATETLTVCERETTQMGGYTFVGIGEHEVLLSGSEACDTVLQLNLIPAADTTLRELDTLVCVNNYVTVLGQEFGTPGRYRLQSSDDAYCPEYLDLSVRYRDNPILSLFSDTTLTYGSRIQLSPLIESKFELSWEWTPADLFDCPSCPNPVLYVERQDSLRVRVVDSLGCVADAQALVRIDIGDLQAPNAMSLREARTSRRFTGYSTNDAVHIKRLSIFSRWGELLYTGVDMRPNDFGRGWDGQYRSQPVQSGVYVYLFEYVDVFGEEKILEGSLTVLP